MRSFHIGGIQMALLKEFKPASEVASPTKRSNPCMNLHQAMAWMLQKKLWTKAETPCDGK